MVAKRPVRVVEERQRNEKRHEQYFRPDGHCRVRHESSLRAAVELSWPLPVACCPMLPDAAAAAAAATTAASGSLSVTANGRLARRLHFKRKKTNVGRPQSDARSRRRLVSRCEDNNLLLLLLS